MEIAENVRKDLGTPSFAGYKKSPPGFQKTSLEMWQRRCYVTNELDMQGSTKDQMSTGYVAIHPLDSGDEAITAAMLAMVPFSSGLGYMRTKTRKAKIELTERQSAWVAQTHRDGDGKGGHARSRFYSRQHTTSSSSTSQFNLRRLPSSSVGTGAKS
jgi:hypothetical protein